MLNTMIKIVNTEVFNTTAISSLTYILEFWYNFNISQFQKFPNFKTHVKSNYTKLHVTAEVCLGSDIM